MSITLHIERLVVDQALLGEGGARALREGIERELSLRLTQAGTAEALQRIGAVAELDPCRLPPAAHPGEGLGARIASGIHQGLAVARGVSR
jgi:hypothetical protein